MPQQGPQLSAFHSPADVLLYGGAAGGGKTDLAIGLACTLHRQSLFIRREAKQLGGVLDRVEDIIDPGRRGYSSQTGEWNLPAWDGTSRKMVIGSIKNLGDEQKYQGRPRDLLVIDEAANCLEEQVRFLMGWVRSAAGVRTRTLMCSNPPTGPEGYWLIEMFAPWLDPNHELYGSVAPGELLWYTTQGGRDTLVDSGDPVEMDGELIYPKSRTFIPAKVGDNKYLGHEYLRELQALPEPLRSQMLYGDFMAGRTDSEWQVIPSAWVEAAQKRWEPRELDPARLVSLGVDPSRGGQDDTIIAAREDWYFHELQSYSGHEMQSGGDVCAKVLELAGHTYAPVHVDVIGIGASVVDHLTAYIAQRCVPMNAAAKADDSPDYSGTLRFINQRAQWWWRMRDLLDPANAYPIALPPDQRLKAELCAPRYQMMATGIKIESKEDLIKRLGRSTDKADAVIMCAQMSAVGAVQSIKQGRM